MRPEPENRGGARYARIGDQVLIKLTIQDSGAAEAGPLVHARQRGNAENTRPQQR